MSSNVSLLQNSSFPCTRIDFLGIPIDTDEMLFCLPEDKIVRTTHFIQKLLSAGKTTLRELQCLLGYLVFTSRLSSWVVFFLSVYIERLVVIRLTKNIKQDLRVWLSFLSEYNGHAVRQDEFITAGYGTFFNGKWSAELGCLDPE